jgi:hypothetical protein
MNEEEEDGVSDSLDAQEGEEGQAFQNPGHLGTEANRYFFVKGLTLAHSFIFLSY